jgi:hypothetical protein
VIHTRIATRQFTVIRRNRRKAMAFEDEIKRTGGQVLYEPPPRVEPPTIPESLGPNAPSTVVGQPTTREAQAKSGYGFGDEKFARDYANVGINQEAQRGFGQNPTQQTALSPSVRGWDGNTNSFVENRSMVSPELQGIIDKVTGSSMSPRQRTDLTHLAGTIAGLQGHKITADTSLGTEAMKQSTATTLAGIGENKADQRVAIQQAGEDQRSREANPMMTGGVGGPPAISSGPWFKRYEADWKNY